MKYRMLGKSGLKAGEVGLGCEHLEGKDFQTVDGVIKAALDCGINIMDVFMPNPQVRENIGKSLVGNREKVLLQGHIGAIYVNGQYQRSRDPEQGKRFFENFMQCMQTDYVDIGMIHFVDTLDDWDRVVHSGIVDYALQLKKKGIIRATGLSSHDPVTALKAVNTGLIDVLMFSINPAYDLLPADTKLDDFFVQSTFSHDRFKGTDPKRALLYQTCERLGVGITVMKSLGAGQLLHDKTSPFGKGMTVHQCMHYALTRPAVASVLIGCKTPSEVYEAAQYIEKNDAEKDYSTILSNTPLYSMKGKCMYCNHCLPCPSHIDIATVTKYLDLALISGDSVPESVAGHYNELGQTAQDCIECGSCEQNCPFGVSVIENMRKAKEMFNR